MAEHVALHLEDDLLEAEFKVNTPPYFPPYFPIHYPFQFPHAFAYAYVIQG
jgi:hypothetical protein